MRDLLSLKLIQKLKGELVLRRQRFLTNDSFHGRSVLANSILGIHLVGDVAMVFAGTADSRFHETRERGEHINGRVDATII